MSSISCRSSPLAHLVAILAVVCLAGCVAGSCLSYGHSCWGAHGKRSGKGSTDTQWFISKLAMEPPTDKQPLEQWYLNPHVESDDSQRKDQIIQTPEQDLEDPVLPVEITGDEREVYIMEQPPRLFRILNHLPSKLELKTPERK